MSQSTQVSSESDHSRAADAVVPVDMEARLALYEELFKERYGERDEAYMTILCQPAPPQPCVLNWYSRPKRTFDWARQRGGPNDNHRGGGNFRPLPYDRSQPHQSYRGREGFNSHSDHRGGYGGRGGGRGRHEGGSDGRRGSQYGSGRGPYGNDPRRY